MHLSPYRNPKRRCPTSRPGAPPSPVLGTVAGPPASSSVCRGHSFTWGLVLMLLVGVVMLGGIPGTETAEGQGQAMPSSPPQGAGSPSLKQSVQKPKQNPDKRGEDRRDKDTENSAWPLPHKDRNVARTPGLPVSEDAGKALAPGSRLAHGALEGHGVCLSHLQGSGDTQERNFSGVGGTQMSPFVETSP